MRGKILSVGILLGLLTGCSGTTTDTTPLQINSNASVITPVSPATTSPATTSSTVASSDPASPAPDDASAPIAEKCLKYMVPVREYYRASDAERAKAERVDAVAALLESVSQYCTPEEYIRYLEAVKAEIGA